MNLIETGVITGILAGAACGVAVSGDGIVPVTVCTLAGAIVGAFVGWAYAFLVIFLTVSASVVARSARGPLDEELSYAAMARMDPIIKRGVVAAGIAAVAGLLYRGWGLSVVAALVVGASAAVIAVAWYEWKRRAD